MKMVCVKQWLLFLPFLFTVQVRAGEHRTSDDSSEETLQNEGAATVRSKKRLEKQRQRNRIVAHEIAAQSQRNEFLVGRNNSLNISYAVIDEKCVKLAKDNAKLAKDTSDLRERLEVAEKTNKAFEITQTELRDTIEQLKTENIQLLRAKNTQLKNLQ